MIEKQNLKEKGGVLDVVRGLTESLKKLEKQYESSQNNRNEEKERIDKICKSIFTQDIWMESYKIITSNSLDKLENEEGILSKLNQIE